jgi:hypothetical protein
MGVAVQEPPISIAMAHGSHTADAGGPADIARRFVTRRTLLFFPDSAAVSLSFQPEGQLQ